MAIANPEKTAAMKKAVNDVIWRRYSNDTAAKRHGLHPRSVANAVCKARKESMQVGLHPALVLFSGI